MSTFGWLSSSAYSISCGVHHAFMPTHAAPTLIAGPVADDPLGVVAHRQGDAVARLHALVDQVVGQLAHLRVDLGVGVVLVLVADVLLVAVGGRLSHSTRMFGGAASNTRIGTPRTSMVLMWKGEPGASSSARAAL